jgi:hypothetical protein
VGEAERSEGEGVFGEQPTCVCAEARAVMDCGEGGKEGMRSVPFRIESQTLSFARSPSFKPQPFPLFPPAGLQGNPLPHPQFRHTPPPAGLQRQPHHHRLHRESKGG